MEFFEFIRVSVILMAISALMAGSYFKGYRDAERDNGCF